VFRKDRANPAAEQPRVQSRRIVVGSQDHRITFAAGDETDAAEITVSLRCGSQSDALEPAEADPRSRCGNVHGSFEKRLVDVEFMRSVRRGNGVQNFDLGVCGIVGKFRIAQQTGKLQRRCLRVDKNISKRVASQFEVLTQRVYEIPVSAFQVEQVSRKRRHGLRNFPGADGRKRRRQQHRG